MPDDDTTIVSGNSVVGEAVLPPETVIDERFLIRGLIGRGGMCSVYEAQHKQLKRRVAIKLLHLASIASVDAVARFQREAILASEVKHPNIIEIFGFGMWQSRPYIAMEFLEGRTLAEIVEQEGCMPEPRAQKIFEQICDALQTAHEHQIVHRDLKPSNVMVCADDRVKLVDFGIARLLPESSEEVQKLTQTGQVLGSFFYMSPEQCMSKPVNAKSDLYSFGCLMHKVLTGNPPFTGDNPFAIMGQHLGAPPPAMAGASARMDAIAKWCLRKEPSERPQSAAQLKAVFEGEDLKATIPVYQGDGTVTQKLLVDSPGKRKFAIAGVATLLVAAIGIAVGAYFLTARHDVPPSEMGDRSLKAEHDRVAEVERLEKEGKTTGLHYYNAVMDAADAMTANGKLITATTWLKRVASRESTAPKYIKALAYLHIARCCIALASEKQDSADVNFRKAMKLSEDAPNDVRQQIRVEYADFLMHVYIRRNAADRAEDLELARTVLNQVIKWGALTPFEAKQVADAKQLLAELDRISNSPTPTPPSSSESAASAPQR